MIDEDSMLFEDDELYPAHALAVILNPAPAMQTLALKSVSLKAALDVAVDSTCSSSDHTPRRLRGENGV